MSSGDWILAGPGIQFTFVPRGVFRIEFPSSICLQNPKQFSSDRRKDLASDMLRTGQFRQVEAFAETHSSILNTR